MAAPSTSVAVYFGNSATGDGIFQLDHSLLDGTDVLGGDTGTDVSDDVARVSFRRGRNSQLFEVIDPATGQVDLYNEDRTYDPLYAAGTHYGNFKPGKRVNISTLGISVLDGKVADWNLDYDLSTGRSMAYLSLEDGLAVLGRQEFDEWTTTASQTAGDRYTDVLNRAEVGWPGGARDLDDGVSTLQADLVTWGSNVLNYCQLVQQSDLGLFFMSRDGLLTFRDRHANIGGTPSVAFGTGGIPIQGVQSSIGAEVYYTKVIVDREGGIAQSYTTATAADDGVRSLTITGLLQDSDPQALEMATFLANAYSSGDTRISMVRVLLDDQVPGMTTEDMLTVLRLDLASLVSVSFTPNSLGDAIEQWCLVQGIDHDVDCQLGSHWVTVWLTKFDQTTPFILDDPVYGVLDGPGLLIF